MKVILVMALTLDGKIARNVNDKVDWTGKQDKKKFVRITRKAGVMIMGSRTFDAIGKVLPGRKNIVLTRNTDRHSNDDNLVFTDKSPAVILKELEEEGFKEAALIGGSIINSMFALLDLIDEIHVTIVPKLFGRGLSLFKDTLETHLQLLDVDRIDDDYLLLKYAVKHPVQGAIYEV